MNKPTDLSHSKVSEKLYGLDHLRALAIILVFLFHYKNPIFAHPGWLEDFARFGWTGVDLFFVLSGFLISSQLFSQIAQGRSISLKEFFIKRSLRILPAFWVVLAIYFCWPFFHEREQLNPLWKYLTFTQNIGLDVYRFGTFSHAWSLCVEEHFYLLLPFILVLLSAARVFSKGYWILIALFAGGLLLRHFIWTTHYFPISTDEGSGIYWFRCIYYPTYTRLDGLLVGVSIAAFCQFSPGAWRRLSKFGNQLIAAGLVALGTCYFLCFDMQSYSASVFGYPAVAAGYGMVVMGALSPSCFLYKWHSKSTAFIAALSYAIYLSHKGIIHITQEAATGMGMEADSNFMFMICIITCIIGALLLHYAVEKPFMKLRKKILK